MENKINKFKDYLEIVNRYKTTTNLQEKTQLKKVIAKEFFRDYNFDIKEMTDSHSEVAASQKILQTAFSDIKPVYLKTNAICVSWVRDYPDNFTYNRVTKQLYALVYETKLSIQGIDSYENLLGLAREGAIVMADYKLQSVRMEPNTRDNYIISDEPDWKDFVRDKYTLATAAKANEPLFDTMLDMYEKYSSNQVEALGESEPTDENPTL